MDVTILIFLLVYLAMALGHLPFFRVDRTGAAVVGALAATAYHASTASAVAAPAAAAVVIASGGVAPGSVRT